MIYIALAWLLLAKSDAPAQAPVQTQPRTTLQEKVFPGIVPDEKTACAIGEAVMGPMFGERAVAMSKPFNATLKKGIWRVVGTPPKNLAGSWDPIYIYIVKVNGWIIEVSRLPEISPEALKTYDMAMSYFLKHTKGGSPVQGTRPDHIPWSTGGHR